MEFFSEVLVAMFFAMSAVVLCRALLSAPDVSSPLNAIAG
jgi:hypothetical protein